MWAKTRVKRQPHAVLLHPSSAGGFCVNSGLAGLAQRGLANPRADVAELGMEGTQAEQEAGDEAEGIVLWQSI